MMIGAISGAAAGLLAACAFSWNAIAGSYTVLGTFWADCGPHIFIPIWMGAVIGLAARLSGDSVSGFVITLVAGIAAGFLAPGLFTAVFGQVLRVSFGFIRIAYASEMVLALFGAIAAIFWYWGVNKAMRWI